jgi:lysophospholipase L1-like esterase
MHSGNVGDSKIWPFYLKPVYTKKSYAVREIYQNIAKKYNIEYVDIIASPIAGIIEGHDDTYYANDYLHLSGAGYGLWFDEIKKHIK